MKFDKSFAAHRLVFLYFFNLLEWKLSERTC